MARSLRHRNGRSRWLLPVLALAATAVLGGCVAYPDYGYPGYYGYGYGYNNYGYYGSAPYYSYPSGGYLALGVGGGWGDHDWHGDRHRGDWHR